MKRFFVLTVACVFICFAAAGNQKLPDLIDRLSAAQQLEEKLEIYWEIYLETLSDDPNLYYDLMVKFNDLAINHGNAEDKAKSFWALARMNEKLGTLDGAFKNYLKSNYWYKQAGMLEFAGDGLKNIGILLRNINEFDKANHYFSEALEIFTTLNLENKIINTHRSISLCKIKEKNYHGALRHANKALAKAISTHNDKYINIILNLVGMIHYYKEDYTTARNNYFNSIKNIDYLENKTEILGMAYNNIGETYLEQKNFSKAYDYFQKALVEKQKLNKPTSTAITLKNIGMLHLIENQIDSAIFYLERTLSLVDISTINFNNNLKEAPSLLIAAYQQKRNPDKKDYERLLELNREYIEYIKYSSTDKNQRLLNLALTNGEVKSQAKYHEQKAKSLQSRSIWIITLALLAILGLLVLLYYREKRFKHFIKQMWQDIKDI